MERLQKYLARAGISSRRAAEQLILDGRVKVNGQVVTTLGTKVDGNKDLVVMDGAPVVASNERQWYLFYKPPGVVTTMHDPQGRPTVGEYVERLEGRVFPVGRLDYDAEGALLLTDDGETANKLMHPKHQVPRVYLAKVKGNPDDASLEKLRGGVRLEDGLATPTEVSRFERAEKNTWLKIVVTEGRPHLVKRLCAAIGHPVVRLYRPQHAGIGVEGVKPGEFRPLTVDEVRQVKAAGDGRSSAPNELRLPARRHGHGASSNDSPARPSGRAMSEPEETEGEEPVSRADTEADAPRGRSGASRAGSGDSRERSGASRGRSGAPRDGSGESRGRSGQARAESREHADARTGSDASRERSGEAREGAYESNERSDEARAGADAPRGRSGRAGSDESRERSDEARAGADAPRGRSGQARAGSDESHEHSDEARAGTDAPRGRSGQARAGSDESREHSDEARAGSDAPRERSGQARAGSDESREHSDEARGGSDARRERSGQARAGADAPRGRSGQARAGSDESREHSDEARAGSDAPRGRSGPARAGSGASRERSAPRERSASSNRDRPQERSASRPSAPVRRAPAQAEAPSAEGPARPFRAPRFGAAFKSRSEAPSGGGRGFKSAGKPVREFDPRRAPKPGAQGMVRGSDRPASSRPMKGAVKGAAFERAAPGKSAERDTGFRGRSATGDEGGGSFDTSPRPEGMRGSIHRGTTAGSRAGAGSSAGYQGTGVPTGRDRFAARATTSVKGAFGNKRPGSKGPPRDAGRGPPRGKGGGGKGGFRGGR